MSIQRLHVPEFVGEEGTLQRPVGPYNNSRGYHDGIRGDSVKIRMASDDNSDQEEIDSAISTSAGKKENERRSHMGSGNHQQETTYHGTKHRNRC